MTIHRLLFAMMALIIFSSCASLRESAKYKLADGIYSTAPFSGRRLVITTVGDTIAVAPAYKTDKGWTPDSNHVSSYTSTLRKADVTTLPSQRYFNESFDLDFLTILAKYRPAQGALPPALHTTTYNGTVFAGYRIDEYFLHYDDSPLPLYKRDQSHYGISGGIFTGFGATPLNSNVTLPAIDYEYDGFIISSGIAFTVAIQNITAGIAIGQDRLLDKNHSAWIYQGKPWIGLGLGLNLN